MSSFQLPTAKNMNTPYSAPIPVREQSHDDDNDDDDCLTTATLASSAWDFRREHGRTYHGYRDGKHIFPNDDVAAQNEKIAHAMFLKTLDDRHFLAPIENPRQILDIGTGIGLWALDMADAYPESNVRGTDLSPLDIRGGPPNFDFIIEDADEENWIGDRRYDFVHLRSLFGTDITWGRLYEQVFENMESGGYIEQCEVEIIPRPNEGSLSPDSIYEELAEITRQMRPVTGRDYNITDGMKALMAEAGFVDLVQKRFKLPLGAWSSDQRFQQIGELMEGFVRTGLEGWVMAAFVRYFGETEQKVKDLCRRAFEAMDKGEERIYYTLVVVYGRKP